MVSLKTTKEIKIMAKGGEILAMVLDRLIEEAKVGVSLKSLDKLAEKLIVESGAEPSFKKVKDYHWTICACPNDVVVHGVPSDYILKKGDVLGIDCGVYLDGFHTDSAWTLQIGNSEKHDNKSEVKKFLDKGKEALLLAIKEVKPDNYIYDISKIIQQTIEKAGYSVVKVLVGHGVGKNLHEDPEIPGFINKKRKETLKICPGMVFAIEVIYNMGSGEVVYKKGNKWTIVTKDGKISGLFEVTVAVTPHGSLVLTQIQSLKNKLTKN